MTDKPTTAAGYTATQSEMVRRTCLYVATKLGDLMDDLVIVGGLVPTLLIDSTRLPAEAEPHVGTNDLDVGLSVLLLDEQRYRTLTHCLRAAGFSQDTNDAGNPTRQRWVIAGQARVTVDFLIAPTLPTDRGGRLRNIEPDFAALIAPGLHLAFEDRVRITLSGATILGERATRDIWVCGPGAFVVLKAFAFRLRGENKDAYDLYYLVRNFESGPASVAAKLERLLRDNDAKRAISFLSEDFSDIDGVGPLRVAKFVSGGVDDELQADVVQFLADLLARLHVRLSAADDQVE